MGDNNDENYNAEEQEMEAQALEAIFDKHFSIISSSSTSQTTQQWSIELYPEQQGEDGVNNSSDVMNHVGCKLIVTLPIDYPELSIPTIDIEIIKGLADEHRITIQELATEEAKANIGTPCIFAIAERIREWLADNNISGLDDISMHAIMMRKEKEKQQREEKQSQRIVRIVIIIFIIVIVVIIIVINIIIIVRHKTMRIPKERSKNIYIPPTKEKI